MDKDDLIAIDRCRARFSGLSAAVAIAIEGPDKLNMENMRDMLHEGAKWCSEMLDKHNWWQRYGQEEYYKKQSLKEDP